MEPAPLFFTGELKTACVVADAWAMLGIGSTCVVEGDELSAPQTFEVGTAGVAVAVGRFGDEFGKSFTASAATRAVWHCWDGWNQDHFA